jgi:hypothetical protein
LGLGVKPEVIVKGHEIGQRIVSAMLRCWIRLTRWCRTEGRLLDRRFSYRLLRHGRLLLSRGVIRVQLLKKSVEIVIVVVARGGHRRRSGRWRR